MDSNFASLELLTLELLLPPSGIPTNMHILDDTISSISYISQVTSTPTISDQFSMDTRRNIYVVSIDNYDPDLDTKPVQILQGK